MRFVKDDSRGLGQQVILDLRMIRIVKLTFFSSYSSKVMKSTVSLVKNMKTLVNLF